MELKLSPEQAEIVGCDDDQIVVRAYAGTGKTHTLRAFAAARPDKKFLYLVFNRKNAEEARRKFPSNVRAVTSHSLAWNAGGMGRLYGPKLVSKVSAWDASKALGVDPGRAAKAVRIVSQWCSSAYPSIVEMARARLRRRGASHKEDEDPVVFRTRETLAEGERAEIARSAPLAVRLWSAMKDPDGAVGMTHDGYLKVWSLEGSPVDGYDYVLFDEAQDANPATLEILRRRAPAMRLVAVGDDYQAIYRFRGGVNALCGFEAMGARCLSLTHTWRFGREIAEASNWVLAARGSEKPLVGEGGSGRLVSREEALAAVDARPGSRAVLTRGNISALVMAMETPGPVHFNGGGSAGYRADLIEDVYRLRYGPRSQIRDREVRACASWAELEQYAEATEEIELNSAIDFVSRTGASVPGMLEDLRKRETGRADQAGWIFSTTHRAKGLEWDHVVIGEFVFEAKDFITEGIKAIRRGRGFSEEAVDETNLLYVAATRARVSLAPNALLYGMREAAATLAAERGVSAVDGRAAGADSGSVPAWASATLSVGESIGGAPALSGATLLA